MLVLIFAFEIAELIRQYGV